MIDISEIGESTKFELYGINVGSHSETQICSIFLKFDIKDAHDRAESTLISFI